MMKLNVFRFKRLTTGKVTEFKAETCLDGVDHFALVKGGGTLRLKATILMKNKWSIDLGEEVTATEISVIEPPQDTVPSQDPEDDDIEEEDIGDKIEPTPITPGVTGDLTKNIGSHEYNVWANKDKIGTSELLSMKAHVESNYALAEGNRKLQQARAKRAMLEMVERRGVGFVPE
jgi:hypothetical protein